MNRLKFFIGTMTLFLGFEGFSANSNSANTESNIIPTDMILAKNKKSKKRSSKIREKRIVREGRYKAKKSGDKTSLDFDSVDIGGNRKAPEVSFIGNAKSRNGYDFIKIRLSWHPEMIQSGSSLELSSN